MIPSRAVRYSVSATSGLLTTIAAGTASAGHIAVARFAHATRKFHVTRLRAFWQTVAGFTAAQEVSIAAYLLTTYSAAHTGGTAFTPRILNSDVASSLAVRVGDTAALTAGTHTIADQLFKASFAELAAAATVQKGFIDEEMSDEDEIVTLTNATGILIRNEVLGGAGGTGRLTFEVDGYET